VNDWTYPHAYASNAPLRPPVKRRRVSEGRHGGHGRGRIGRLSLFDHRQLVDVRRINEVVVDVFTCIDFHPVNLSREGVGSADPV
jgi:hypothetical protein